MRQEITMNVTSARPILSNAANYSASIQQPVFKTWKNNSISYQARYQLASSLAPSSVVAVQLVKRRLRTGFFAAGASISLATRPVTSKSPALSRRNLARCTCKSWRTKGAVRFVRRMRTRIDNSMRPIGSLCRTWSHNSSLVGRRRLCWGAHQRVHRPAQGLSALEEGHNLTLLAAHLHQTAQDFGAQSASHS